VRILKSLNFSGRKIYVTTRTNRTAVVSLEITALLDNAAALDNKWVAQVSLLRPGFLLEN
jgi:hypothetical protein